MSFGTPIRDASGPGTDPRGIGGTSSKIWATSALPSPMQVCELSTEDFSVVRSEDSIGDSPGGIGGDESKIWYQEAIGAPALVHELSTTDFSSVRSAARNGRAVGGDSYKIWHSDFNANLIQELSLADFSIIRSEDAPGNQTLGIGGDSSKIWHTNYGDVKIYDLSITDFSVFRSAESPRTGSWGIGGDSYVIWYCADIADRVYELHKGYGKEVLRPNAQGDECEIEYQVGASCPDHYLNVDEIVADTTTRVGSKSYSAYQRDLYNIETHSIGSGVINFIKVYARCISFGSPDQNSLKIGMKTGGTLYEGDEEQLEDDVWINYFKQWDTNLQAERAWSWDDIDALQIGISLRASSGLQYYSDCTQVWVVVDYTEEEETKVISMSFHKGRTTTIFIGDD